MNQRFAAKQVITDDRQGKNREWNREAVDQTDTGKPDCSLIQSAIPTQSTIGTLCAIGTPIADWLDIFRDDCYYLTVNFKRGKITLLSGSQQRDSFCAQVFPAR